MATHGDLLAAIRERNEGRVAEILKAEPNLASARPTDGPSAMLFATYMGVAPVIALVRARVEPDACEAAALGDMPALTALLKKKENANARSGDGWTALHLAGFFGKRDAVTLLLKHGASVSAVAGTPDRNQPLQASISGACDLVILTALIGAGADVNHAGASGITPLHSAGARGNLDAIRLLGNAGANADVRMTDGRTPWDLAQERQHPEAAKLLREMAGG